MAIRKVLSEAALYAALSEEFKRLYPAFGRQARNDPAIPEDRKPPAPCGKCRMPMPIMSGKAGRANWRLPVDAGMLRCEPGRITAKDVEIECQATYDLSGDPSPSLPS